MSKTKFQIKTSLGSVLFEHECEDNSLKKTLEAAVSGDADLCGADLRGADLRDADLRDADLCGADLCGADLRDADLCGADLCGADLCGADLRGATIYWSDNDFSAENKIDRFIYKTPIESVETEMKHDVGTWRYSFNWKNVLKIKSWKLKETEEKKVEESEKVVSDVPADKKELAKLVKSLKKKGYSLQSLNLNNKDLFLGFSGAEYLEGSDVVSLLGLAEPGTKSRKMVSYFVD